MFCYLVDQSLLSSLPLPQYLLTLVYSLFFPKTNLYLFLFRTSIVSICCQNLLSATYTSKFVVIFCETSQFLDYNISEPTTLYDTI